MSNSTSPTEEVDSQVYREQMFIIADTSTKPEAEAASSPDAEALPPMASLHSSAAATVRTSENVPSLSNQDIGSSLPTSMRGGIPGIPGIPINYNRNTAPGKRKRTGECSDGVVDGYIAQISTWATDPEQLKTGGSRHQPKIAKRKNDEGEDGDMVHYFRQDLKHLQRCEVETLRKIIHYRARLLSNRAHILPLKDLVKQARAITRMVELLAVDQTDEKE